MKKKILSMVLVAALAATVMCGCTKNENTGKTEDGKTLLTVSNWPSKEDEEMKTMNSLKDRFEEKYPDIKIKTDTFTFDVKTFYAKASGGELPTLFMSPATEIDKVISGDYCADLTDVMKKEGVYDQLDKSILELMSRDGKLYCYPQSVGVLGIVYNADIFRQAGLMNEDGTPKYPQTWDELAETAVKIKEKTGKNGFVLATSNKSGGWLFTNIAWSYGTEFVKKDSNGKWKATFDSKECEKALEYVRDLKWKYDALPADILINGQDMLNSFGAGNSAMMIYAPAAAANYVTLYGFKSENFGSFPIPAGPVRRSGLLGASIWYASKNSTDEQIEAGIKWLKFRGMAPDANDEQLKSIEDGYKLNISRGDAVGIGELSPWKKDSPVVKAKNDLMNKYANFNTNQVKPYNDSIDDISKSGIELHPEVEVCAQDLYGILDNCIQQVLNDKDANIKEILKKANAEFQSDYLDNIDY